MIYQLNNTFSDGNGLELINPLWEVVGVYDNFKNNTCQIYLHLWIEGAAIHHRHIAEFSYQNDEWENADAEQAVLSLPEFSQSTLI
jgi:hypothetical protein